MPVNKLIFEDAEKARDAITASQKKEIAKLYENWAAEIGERAKYYSHKSAPSYAVAERQMKELMKQMEATSHEVANEIYTGVKKNIYLVADSVVQQNVEWLKSLGFAGDTLDAAFNYVPDEIVRNIITGQIYDSGWSLSKRIWSDNEDTMKTAYQIVAGGMAQNKSIYEIAKDLESYVEPGAKKPWNLTMKDGRKIYPKQVDYNAQRLARTLVQHGYQQSFKATTEKNPFIEAYKWNANGSRVCDLCMERETTNIHGLGPGIYPKDQMPLDHPNGMCTMEPVVVDNLVDQLADWFNNPDGTYPEIDEFASNFGYDVKASKPKNKVTFESITDNLQTYVGGGYGSVKDAVTEDEFNFIKENMTTTKEKLYRVENAKFTYDKYELSEGDVFEFENDIRSFTRDNSYLGKMLDPDEDIFDIPVIFETVGPTKHFNMDKYAEGYYENQSESLVGGKFEVVGENMIEIDGVFYQVIKIKQILK